MPGALGNQKRVSDSPRTVVTVISHHGVLGIKPRSPARAARADPSLQPSNIATLIYFL